MTIITISREMLKLLPPGVRRKAGLKPGDTLEVKVSGGVITMLPRLPVVVADTPAQRRAVKAKVAKARRGSYYGPFKSVGGLAAFLETCRRGGIPPRQCSAADFSTGYSGPDESNQARSARAAGLKFRAS